MNKFENVKVGDKVMVSVVHKINSFRQSKWQKVFFVECEVFAKTKTQFKVNLDNKVLRFKKDNGCGIGDNCSWAYFKGESVKLAFSLEKTTIPTKCQKQQADKYLEDLYKVEGYAEFRPQTMKHLGSALHVSRLIREIESIFEQDKNEGN